MTVNDTTELSSGLYVPYRGLISGLQPSGTINIVLSGTGAAGGGNVNLNLFMSKEEFGFHAMLTLHYAHSVDNLVAASTVQLQYSTIGNERLFVTAGKIKETEAIGSSFVATWLGDELPIPIEPNLEVGVATRTVLTVQWDTNTDGKSYQAALFGLLWDMEALARYATAEMPSYFFGVR